MSGSKFKKQRECIKNSFQYQNVILNGSVSWRRSERSLVVIKNRFFTLFRMTKETVVTFDTLSLRVFSLCSRFEERIIFYRQKFVVEQRSFSSR